MSEKSHIIPGHLLNCNMNINDNKIYTAGLPLRFLTNFGISITPKQITIPVKIENKGIPNVLSPT